jgi:formate-dependent nitrite reductase cytochrome c552 subunit
MNAQCRFCHHQSHDLLIAGKREMWETGDLRCVDCHMAAYIGTEGRMERFHNFKVEANLPHSCSGGLGRSMACHEGKNTDWSAQDLV